MFTSSNGWDGEVDFVVLAPGNGIILLEIKGGSVYINQSDGHWYSKDKNKKTHQIKNPIKQVKSQKFALIEYLTQFFPKSQLPTIGHGVFFTDCNRASTSILTPEIDPTIVGFQEDLPQISDWLQATFTFWNSYRSTEDFDPTVCDNIIRKIVGTVEARPLVKSTLENNEASRIELTNNQLNILSSIQYHSKAIISGGAGTGKTVLAVERAKQLSNMGLSTLLLCYNQLLGDALKASCQGQPNLHTMTFHQLAEWRCECVRIEKSRCLKSESMSQYPDMDLFDFHLPLSLANSTDLLPERYDAIVVDEAQDFKEEYWLGVELLLSQKDPHLYLFTDTNQQIYTTNQTLPIASPPFVLTTNCRNTRQIHDVSYKYYRGLPVHPSTNLDGDPVESITAPTLDLQAQKICRQITELVIQEHVSPSDISVLVVGEPKRDFFNALRSNPLPNQCVPTFDTKASRHTPNSNELRVNTVKRFKGLESDIVFLWGFESAPKDVFEELMYVGLSRAKSILKVVGTNDAVSMVL